MTIREFLELACDDGDTVELFDISEYTEFCDTVDALLNDGETMDVIEMEIMSWTTTATKELSVSIMTVPTTNQFGIAVKCFKTPVPFRGANCKTPLPI